jgi:hypothetical protein
VTGPLTWLLPAADTMVMHETVAAGERLLPQQRREPVCEDSRMNEQNGLAGAMHLVFNLDVVERRSVHESAGPRKAYGRMVTFFILGGVSG